MSLHLARDGDSWSFHEADMSLHLARDGDSWSFHNLSAPSFCPPPHISQRIHATYFPNRGIDFPVSSFVHGRFFDSKSAYNSLWMSRVSERWKMGYNLGPQLLPQGQNVSLANFMGETPYFFPPCCKDIIPSGSCSFCPGVEETILHVLRDCPRAVEVWDKQPALSPSSNSVSDWICANLSSFSSDNHLGKPWDVCFSIICWRIWTRRNRWVFEKDNMPIESWWKSTPWMIEEILSLSQPKSLSSKIRLPALIALVAPQVLIKTDASFSSSTLTAGIGCVCRDHQGNWCEGMALHVPCSSAVWGEALAVLFSLKWAKDRGFSEGLLLSDCDRVVQGINLQDQVWDELTNLYNECRELLQQLLRLSLKQGKRGQVQEADVVARMARQKLVISTTFCRIVPKDSREELLSNPGNFSFANSSNNLHAFVYETANH